MKESQLLFKTTISSQLVDCRLRRMRHSRERFGTTVCAAARPSLGGSPVKESRSVKILRLDDFIANFPTANNELEAIQGMRKTPSRIGAAWSAAPSVRSQQC